MAPIPAVAPLPDVQACVRRVTAARDVDSLEIWLGLAPLHMATLWDSQQSLAALGCWHRASGVLLVWGDGTLPSLLCQGLPRSC